MSIDFTSASPGPARRSPVRDDVAYFLPMATFLVLIWVGGLGTPTPAGNTAYPWAYLARAVIVGAMLVLFWPAYTRIRWNHWWLGLLVGVAGFFQWVEMQKYLEAHVEFFRPSGTPFNPEKFFASPAAFWAFVVLRLFGAVIVVPVTEELFWRDFLWRQIIAPNDFKLAEVGEWDPKAFLGVAVVFAFPHGNWWLSAIVWALLVGALLLCTRSLGACIIAHATTNLMLGAWVLYYRQWGYW